ncbi:hypothetical protein BGZ94_001378, partial [Podila epigama]
PPPLPLQPLHLRHHRLKNQPSHPSQNQGRFQNTTLINAIEVYRVSENVNGIGIETETETENVIETETENGN